MIRRAFSLATAVALMGGLVGPGLADDVVVLDDVYTATTQTPYNYGSEADAADIVNVQSGDYVSSWGVVGTAEVVWLNYGRADGTRVGVAAPGEDVDCGYEITPRLTVGFAGDGLGARVRYWEYDHTTPAFEGGASGLQVDTYTLDFELFETFALNENWFLEIAGGVRYNEFEEIMVDDGDIRINQFNGLGGIVGGELRRMVGARSAVFGRARLALLVDDKRVFNNDTAPVQNVVLNDVTVGMTEVAIGYDFIVPMNFGSLAFLRAQAEWQNWSNYSSSFTDLNNAERFAGQSDVSFHGFGVAIGLVR
jgi:hypothetical protein